MILGTFVPASLVEEQAPTAVLGSNIENGERGGNSMSVSLLMTRPRNKCHRPVTAAKKTRVKTSMAVIALSVVLLIAGTGFAGGRWTAKVLVLGGMPNHVIAAFQGAHTGAPDATDPGTAPLESTTPVALDAKVTELFVPAGIVSAIWIWDKNTGYHFLGNVSPDDSLDAIKLDAEQALARQSLPLTPDESAPSASPETTPPISPAPESEQTTKILVPNAIPGQVIAAFQGAHTDEEGTDPGIIPLESTIPVARDGKVTELFVPVGIASSIWIWDESNGYRFLGNVLPGERSQPVELDASQDA